MTRPLLLRCTGLIWYKLFRNLSLEGRSHEATGIHYGP